MKESEKTEKVRQKEVINKIIRLLSKENMQMYYSSHSDIANEVVEFIASKKDLNRNELDLVSDLKSIDISIMLSLNS